MPSTAYSASNKLALTLAWVVFTLSSIVTVISAARLPADGACWTWGCLSFMLPALTLMFISVHYLNALTGNTLMNSIPKGTQTIGTSETGIVAYMREMHAILHDFQPTLANQPASLARLDNLLQHYCHELSRPVLRAQLFRLTDADQAHRLIDSLARAERLLNRSWSALSDGYEAEAQSACAEAAAIYANLLAKLPQD